jgi:insertion element IS1 protein InsB
MEVCRLQGQQAVGVGGSGPQEPPNRGRACGQPGSGGGAGAEQDQDERYRQWATFYTDDWKAHKMVIPADGHLVSDRKKDTYHFERFFCTLWQRCSWLVKKPLSFSKKLERHVRAIKCFVAHSNLSILL